MMVLGVLAAVAVAAVPVGAVSLAAGQGASLVLGSPTLTSTERGTRMDRAFDLPTGVQLDPSGRILVADTAYVEYSHNGSRVAIFNSLPAADGGPFDVVVGDVSKRDFRFGCTQSVGNDMRDAWSSGARLVAGEGARVRLYNSIPTGDGANADLVLGQTTFTSCAAGALSATSISQAKGVWTDGTRIAVSDHFNDRVLIWNSWPTANGAAASIVLGQASMTTNGCAGGVTAATMCKPSDIWSDGTRLLVVDEDNRRVLVWNTFPTSNGQPADRVIGQASMTTRGAGCGGAQLGQLGAPRGVSSNGTKITISDGNRVLLFDTWPTADGASASRVLGQANTWTCLRNGGASTVSAAGLSGVEGVSTDGTKVVVSDSVHNRILVWSSWPTSSFQAADRVLGHTTFTAAGPSDANLESVFPMSYDDYGSLWAGSGIWPAVTPSGELWISNAWYSQLTRYAGMPTVNNQAPAWMFGQANTAWAFCNGPEDPAPTATSLCKPTQTWTDGTRLLVADSLNNRVKVWNTYPTSANQPADLVLGQSAMTANGAGSGSAAMERPYGVTSDGTRIAVSLPLQHRILVWSSWPTTNGQAANLVLGQPDFVATSANNGGISASSLAGPHALAFGDGKLAAVDRDNHRVLIWSSWPTATQQAAGGVYGQASFTAGASSGLWSPRGVALAGNALFVTDGCRLRYRDPVPTTAVASGAVSVNTGCATTTPAANVLRYPNGVAAGAGKVWVADSGTARVLRHDDTTAPTLTRGAPAVRTCGGIATVTWATNESGTSEVHWGPASAAAPSAYPNHAAPTALNGLTHSRNVTLGAGTWYLRSQTTDWAGLTLASPERSFTMGGAAPAHDAFASPRTIAGNPYSDGVSTFGACTETGEPDHASVPGGSSVWYSWTAPAAGRFVVDTVGSGFDTTLAVYTGSAVGSLTSVATNDDASGRQSRVAYTATAGTTYRIAVDGWYGDSGALTLNARFIANDPFSGAQELTGTAASATGDTTYATRETGEPNHAGVPGSASLWYTWTAPTTGSVTIDTFGSSFDTTLAAYTGSAVNALTLVTGNDDAAGGTQSRITFAATKDTPYRIAVDGYSSAKGSVSLQLLLAPTVTGTTPTSVPQGRQGATVQIAGTGFVPTSTIALDGTGLTITATTYVSPARIDVTINVASTATATARSVTVTNPNSATTASLLTITSPTITVALGVLGYADTVRITAAPFTMAFGSLVPGMSRTIGPAGSGQATPGAAAELTVTSNTDTSVTLSATDFSGPAALGVGALSWRHYGTEEAWTPMGTTAATVEGPTAPATTTWRYSYRLDVPGGQRAGAYATTITYTASPAF